MSNRSTAPSRPGSTASILLIDLPPSILCGIDLLSFTTTAKFKGIKDLPSGFHFVFTSESSSFSLRDGFWFEVPASSFPPSPSSSSLIVRKWDPVSNSLQPVQNVESYRSQLPELWEQHLSPYRQSVNSNGTSDEIVEEVDWPALTGSITTSLLTNMCQSATDWAVSSASTMSEDREDIPGLDAQETGLEERELGSLGINLKKTWREGAVGRERTEGAVDKSWALGDVDSRWRAQHPSDAVEWGDVVLGQMQICFVMVLTVVNYSCLQEWKRCLELALTSKTAVAEHLSWYAKFLVLLTRQMKRCEDVDGGLFDMSDEGGGLLKAWLRTFKRTLGENTPAPGREDAVDAMEELETELQRMYGWELSDDFVRRGNVQLEDGEFVEMKVKGMDAEDEEGEYAPVIVDLNGT